MSRTKEVDEAMYAAEMLKPFAREWLSPNNQYLLILADEVERLEAENKSQQSGVTALRANHDDLQRLYAEIKEACAQEGMERYCTHEHLMAFLKSRLLAGTQIISINETMSVVRRAEKAESRVSELKSELNEAESRYRTVTEQRLALTREINHDLLPRIGVLEQQNAKLCRIWRADHIYIQLLEKELSDVMPLASLHGFISKRADEGTAARHAINQAIAELGTGNPST